REARDRPRGSERAGRRLRSRRSLEIRVLVSPGPPHGEAAEDEHPEERDDLEAVSAAVRVRAQVGDGEHRPTVEDGRGPHRPLRDLLPPFAPDEVDEERDREQERDPRQDPQRGQRRLELQDDDDRDDRENDEEPAHGRVHPGEERAHVPVMYARTASAPATRVAAANQPSRARRSAGAYSHGASTARSASVPYR